MSDARDYLVTIDRDETEARNLLHGTVTKLERKELALITVVESLHDYINDEQPAIRSKAVTYLSRLIEALPSRFLTRQQIQVLCQFLCDRIDDDGAPQGLETLVALPRFSGEMAVTTFRALVQNYQDLQLRNQSQRYRVLTLLSCLLSKWRQAVRGLGPSSVVGITDLISGEKDPRNLMVIFSVLQVVIFEWDIRQYAETLFDAVFCYFPITFRPPPDDPYGITARNLKDRLRDCLAASRYLAPYAFPQLIEKLDSSSLNVKRDVLDTIVACAKSYDVQTLSKYSIPIWDAVKYELFNAQDDEITREVLFALTVLTGRLQIRLSSQVDASDAALEDFVRAVLKECLERLQEPQHKQARPAALILQACATATPTSLSIIVRGAIPPLLTIYQDAASIEQRRVVMEHISGLLVTAKEQAETQHSVLPAAQLKALKDELFQVFSQALMGTSPTEISIRVTAVGCLSHLCEVPGLMDASEQGMIVQYLNEVLLSKDGTRDSALDTAVIEALGTIAQHHSSLLMEITFPELMSRLPDVEPKDDSYIGILEILVSISVKPDISNALVRRCFSRLETVTQKEGSLDYCMALLSSLTYVMQQRSRLADPDLDRHWQRIFDILSRCVDEVNGTRNSTLLSELPVIEQLGKLARAVIRNAGLDKQECCLKEAFYIVCDTSSHSQLWQKSWPASQRSMIILMTYILAAVDSKAQLPFPEEAYIPILDNLIDFALAEEVLPVRKSALQHLALMVNKFSLSDHRAWLKDTLLDAHHGLLSPSVVSRQTLRVGMWLSKALILRLIHVDVLLNRFMELLEHPELGTETARGFQAILANDEILTSENGATIRALASQRMFISCVPVISSKYWTATAIEKENYLLALSGLLAHANKEILISETARLLPLLLSSLEIEHEQVKAAALRTLATLSLEAPECLEGHISSLINRCITIAGNTQSNTQNVRYQGLRCLRGLPEKIPPTKLLPYRRMVSQGVLVVLDDPRREVRKEAVDCRNTWSRLDDTEEDEQ